MAVYDREWFTASMFGKRFASLTEEQFEYGFTLAEHELTSVLCWCPKMYPIALAIKISLLLDGAGVGVDESAPSLEAPGGGHIGILQEDEVFDTRRRYKIVERAAQAASAGAADQLQRIIDACKAPLRIGATLVAGARNRLADDCCVPFSTFADKTQEPL